MESQKLLKASKDESLIFQQNVTMTDLLKADLK